MDFRVEWIDDFTRMMRTTRNNYYAYGNEFFSEGAGLWKDVLPAR